MEKITAYTVNIGEYDTPRTDGIKCFTAINLFNSNTRNSRLPKILSHLFIDTDISVYFDCNIYLRPGLNLKEVVNEYLQDFDIVVQRHYQRDCVYEEIEGAKSRVFGKLEIKKLRQQAEFYKSIGFPEHCKTLAGYQPLIRRHNERIKRFNEAWFAEMCRFSYRDQCSFPYILSQFPELKVRWVDNLGNLTKRDYRHT